MWRASYPLPTSGPQLLNEEAGLSVCPSSSPGRARLTPGVGGEGARVGTVCPSVCLRVWKRAGKLDGKNGEDRLGFLLVLSKPGRAVSSGEIREPTLHTCDCLLSLRSKHGNTNELAITGERNLHNAVRNCQRNPPKKQEQSW